MYFNTQNCVKCDDSDVHVLTKYKRKSNGIRELYVCKKCKTVFSETKNTFMENIKTPISKIATVIEARTEGFAFNAACRIFKISPYYPKRLGKEVFRAKRAFISICIDT